MFDGFPPERGGIRKRVELVLACLAGAGVDSSLPGALACLLLAPRVLNY